MTEQFPGKSDTGKGNDGLIQMPDFITNQPQKPAGYDGFADFARQDRNVPVDPAQLSPFAKVKAEGSPYVLDALGRAVPVDPTEDVEDATIPRTELGEQEKPSLEELITRDRQSGLTIDIPSTKDANVIYRMSPTGETQPGLVKMRGQSSKDKLTYERWVTEKGYLLMREAAIEKAKRVQAEHVGAGVVEVAEAAVSVGAVEAPSVLEATPEPAKTSEDLLGQLAEGLSAEDVRLLNSFASYTQDKALAQKEGDGEGSVRSGQYAGQEYREMSPKAQGIASRYANLWIRLNPID